MDKKMANRLNGVLWPLIVALYFLVSFMTRAWHITWVIFLLGASVTKLIEIMAEDRCRR